MSTHHPRVDFNHWASIFPIETFQQSSGPRQFSSTKKGSPLDLWKPHGTQINGPADLCHIELVRKQYSVTKDLGPVALADIFLWSIKPPRKPYLTKLGGIPHREASKPWPQGADGESYTFIAQFCFIDSKDIISDRVPNDVMLVFFKGVDSVYDSSEIHIEWSSIELESPIKADQCPEPSFTAPKLSGVIYRCSEYPDSWDIFEQEGHYQFYLFPTTQATKISREAFFIQNDLRGDDEELLCVLNSLDFYKPKWPFVDLEALPEKQDAPEEYSELGEYSIMFGDVGCLYFVIGSDGKVRSEMQCY